MSLSPPLPLRDLLDTSLYAGVKVCLQLQHHLFHLCYQPKNLLFCHAQVSHLGHLGNRIAQWCHLSAPTKYLFQKEQNQLFFKVILPASCVSLYNWYWGDNSFRYGVRILPALTAGTFALQLKYWIHQHVVPPSGTQTNFLWCSQANSKKLKLLLTWLY